MKPRVLVDLLFRPMSSVFSPEDRARLDALCEVVWGRDEAMPEDQLAEVAPDLDVIIGGWYRYGSLDRYPKLRAFMEVGGSLPAPDGFDYPTAFARQIRVLSCAPAFAPAVAEMGLSLALACARRVALTDRDFRRGTEPWSHSEFRGETTLYGKQVGFIGFGSLARALRRLLEPWGVHLKVHDPWMTDAYLRTQGVEPAGLDQVLAESDVVFVLATPSGANKGLLNRAKLELLRPGGVFVLLSRAHLVDFDALVGLLQEGRFWAGIDVFPEEPLPADHPIRQVEHAVLSSHRAGAQVESIRAIGSLVVRDLEAVLQGLPPREMQSAEPEYVTLRGKA